MSPPYLTLIVCQIRSACPNAVLSIPWRYSKVVQFFKISDGMIKIPFSRRSQPISVVCIGETGSGKSTILASLAYFLSDEFQKQDSWKFLNFQPGHRAENLPDFCKLNRVKGRRSDLDPRLAIEALTAGFSATQTKPSLHKLLSANYPAVGAVKSFQIEPPPDTGFRSVEFTEVGVKPPGSATENGSTTVPSPAKPTRAVSLTNNSTVLVVLDGAREEFLDEKQCCASLKPMFDVIEKLVKNRKIVGKRQNERKVKLLWLVSKSDLYAEGLKSDFFHLRAAITEYEKNAGLADILGRTENSENRVLGVSAARSCYWASVDGPEHCYHVWQEPTDNDYGNRLRRKWATVAAGSKPADRADNAQPIAAFLLGSLERTQKFDAKKETLPPAIEQLGMGSLIGELMERETSA